MVGRDNDEGVLHEAKLLKAVDGGANGVVELKELTKGTRVVGDVHG